MSDTLRFNLTNDDHVEASQLHAMRGSRGGLWILAAIIWLIYSALAFLAVGEWDWQHAATSAGLGAAVAAVVVLLIYHYTIPRRSRRIFAQQKSLQSEVEASWNEEALDLAAPSGRGKLLWGDFHKWTEGPNVILLYQSDAIFNLFPKRAFSEEALADIRGRLDQAGVQQLKGWR